MMVNATINNSQRNVNKSIIKNLKSGIIMLGKSIVPNATLAFIT